MALNGSTTGWAGTAACVPATAAAAATPPAGGDGAAGVPDGLWPALPQFLPPLAAVAATALVLGIAHWFLVRGDSGAAVRTYESFFLSQSGLRDEEIGSAAASCP